jgi:hypothetical protein
MKEENIGLTEELSLSFENLVKFYGYDEIIPFD